MITVVSFVVISYYVAYVSKVGGIKKKWIPVVAASTGLVCAAVAHFCGIIHGTLMDDIAEGIFSGFAAVGTNEIAKYIFIRKE